MTRPRQLLLLVPLAVAAVLSSCGGDDDDEAAAVSPLDNSGWFLAADSLDVDMPEGAEEITIAFASTDVAGNSGCNNYTSTYTTTDDGGITMGDFVTTRAACEPDVMAVEEAYLAELELVAAFELGDDELTLSDADGNELLHYTTDD